MSKVGIKYATPRHLRLSSTDDVIAFLTNIRDSGNGLSNTQLIDIYMAVRYLAHYLAIECRMCETCDRCLKNNAYDDWIDYDDCYYRLSSLPGYISNHAKLIGNATIVVLTNELRARLRAAG